MPVDAARKHEEAGRVDLSFPGREISGEGDDTAVANSHVGAEHVDGGRRSPSSND
jgi:hypothetical protein